MHSKSYAIASVLSLAACGGVADVLGLNADATTPLVLPVLASAGADREILRGAPSWLDARATYHPQGGSFAVLWQQIDGGPSVYLSSPSDVMPTFVAPIEERELRFRLTASDGALETTDEVVLAVKRTPERLAPRVSTGPDRVLALGENPAPAPGDIPGDVASDITTRWEQVLAEPTSLGTLNEGVGPQASIFRLLAAQGGLESAPSYLVLFPYGALPPGARAPVASLHVAPAIEPGQSIALDASASSDANGDPLHFRWEQTQGDPCPTTSSDTSSLLVTAPRRPQEISLRVFVSDGALESRPAEARISVSAGAGYETPLVQPGADLRTRPGRQVVLDALAGAAPGFSAPASWSFHWSQSAGDPVALEANASGRTANFSAPARVGSLAFWVLASDGVVESDRAALSVQVVASDQNSPPAVHLGASTTQPLAGQLVRLTAAILDPEGDALATFEWIEEPAGAVVLSPPSSVTAIDLGAVVEFTAPEAGTSITFTLRVCDELGACGQDSVVVNVAT